ncbi:MAG: glycosyltransferase [Anaerolineales bacterium]
MKILFVVPYVPNLIRVRPYQLIRNLSALGHAVTVLTIWANAAERADVDALKSQCHSVQAVHVSRLRSWLNCALALPGDAPLQAHYSWTPALLAAAEEAPAWPDVIHVEHLRGARFGLAFKEWRSRQPTRPPIIWDSVDSISLLFEKTAAHSRRAVSRWMARFELGRTQRYERRLLSEFDYITVSAPADRAAMLALAGAAQTAPVTVVPNGVDLDYFAPNPQLAREADTLVITGKMSYHANVTMVMQFVETVLPRLWARRPSVKLWVVGKEPPAQLQALAQDPRITVTGSVPDLRPYLQRAAVAVAPLAYGVGIQNKVLEAMACATPVVASTAAVFALADLRPGREAIVADGPEALADALSGLLADSGRQVEVGQAGRCYVERHHRWQDIVAGLVKVYSEAKLRV